MTGIRDHPLQRISHRAAVVGRKRYSEYEYDEDMSDDDGASSPADGSSPKRFRHTRSTTEDRRFGVPGLDLS